MYEMMPQTLNPWALAYVATMKNTTIVTVYIIKYTL